MFMIVTTIAFEAWFCREIYAEDDNIFMYSMRQIDARETNQSTDLLKAYILFTPYNIAMRHSS